MVALAGSDMFTEINKGADFLTVDPADEKFKNVGALLLDPSCSGSGIVGRDETPKLHLPATGGHPTVSGNANSKNSRSKATGKRKRDKHDTTPEDRILVDDDGNTTVLSSEKDLESRLEALSSFQLALLLHAFKFPAAKKITYSTCSIHAEENEQVVLKALRSDIARQRGWRILDRAHQVRGMGEWPVRGTLEAAEGDAGIADACIRAYKDDGRGVMGFFVAAFCREDPASQTNGGSDLGAEARGAATARDDPRASQESRKSEEVASDGESEWDGFDDD